MTYRIILSLLLILSSNYSYARTVGLGNPKQQSNFNHYLKNTPNKNSLQNVLISKEIKKNDKVIFDKHKLAVKGLLLEDLNPSIYLFKEIISLQSKISLSQDTNDYISESYYRLSNLERLKSKFWIKQGVFFNTKYTPPEKIFNPNIISSFKLQREEVENYSFSYETNKIIGPNSSLFINGRIAGNHLRLHPSAKYQLQIFKDGFQNVSIELSGEEMIKSNKIIFNKIDFGTCRSPKFITYKGLTVDEVFFSKSCVKKQNENSILLSKNNKLTEKLLPRQNIKEKTARNHQKKNIFQKKKTWYIIAGTIILSALVISLSQNNDVKVSPTNE